MSALTDRFDNRPDTARLDPGTRWDDSAVQDYLDELASWAYSQGLVEYFAAKEKLDRRYS